MKKVRVVKEFVSKKDLKTDVVDINKKMTFEEFRVLIEKNGNIKGYPILD